MNSRGGVPGADILAPFARGYGGEGSVSGTASFDIAAGATVTYSLACEQRSGFGGVAGTTMTAIFTPAP